jgi:chaperone BCS1
MTTNHPDKLDPALIRPGRITLNLKLDALTSEDASKIISDYFPDHDIVIPNLTMTPAKLESICQIADNLDELRFALT